MTLLALSAALAFVSILVGLDGRKALESSR